MKSLKSFAPVRWVCAALRATVGEINYRPPTWLAGTARAFSGHPKRVVSVVVLAGLLGGAGWYGWQWWEAHKPQPTVRVVMRELKVEVAAPGVATVGEKGKVTVNSAVISFSESAAPVDQVGKEVNGGVELSPMVAGTWTWVDDQRLSFQPENEWPAGQEFSVRFVDGFFPPEVELDNDGPTFTTPALEVTFSSKSFHTDPKEPTRHEVQATVKTNYAVDLAAFKQAMNMTTVGESDLFTYKGVRPKSLLSVIEDEVAVGRKFFVRSARISIPEVSDFVELKVAKVLMAASGGESLADDLSGKVRVPDKLSGFSISGVDEKIVRTDEGVPEQVLLLKTSGYVAGEQLDGNVHCWVIPKNYRYDSDQKLPGTAAVTDDVLARWSPVELKRVEASSGDGAGMSQMHAFKFFQETGHQLFVRVDAGVEALGGFELAGDHGEYVSIPSFPKEVGIIGKGGLLALNGERKIGLKTRGVEYLRTTFARIPSDQINHLAATTRGDFESPSFKNHWAFNEQNIGRYHRKVVPVMIANNYEACYPELDLDAEMKLVDAGDVVGSRGLFFVNVEGVRPTSSGGRAMEGDATMTDWSIVGRDCQEKRFVLITDLGLLVKRSSDGTRSVFVQSISSGKPVAGVTVTVVAKNGSELISHATDEEGYVLLESVDQLREEKSPAAIIARLGSDVAFIPYRRPDRLIDFSRFDIGGITASQNEKLDAHMFSERGIYRPGDTVHLGAVIRRRDWKGGLSGLPLILEVRDSKGTNVGSRRAPLAADGFVDFSVELNEASPTGNYTATLYYDRPSRSRIYLASHRVRVEDFQPDTMKLDVTVVGAQKTKGWVKPDPTVAKVQLNTLFGFAAADRRVKAKLELSSASFDFSDYPDHIFHNRLVKSSADLAGDTVKLGEKKTDKDGAAEFDLGLGRFDDAAFRMNVFVEGFEAGGGRSVRGATSTLVAPFDHVIGYKPDGPLGYVGADTERSVHIIAIDSSLTPVTVNDLAWRVVESRFVSVLTKQKNGSYAYVSTKRDRMVGDGMIHLVETGHEFKLPTDQVGEMRLELVDSDGRVVMVCPFSVAGKGDSSRSLERDAELEVKLAKNECNSGDELELSIRAPYTGTGLITIERERVMAYKWFQMDSTSSVQSITIPEDVIGTAYVSVSFVRALDSPEVFMSPLSYAVHPIDVNLDRRRLTVDLDVPDVVKPGKELKIGYTASRSGRVVIYAVDAGIHQITDYSLPRPLKHLMEKRALEVKTSQLLDLILPEFSLLKRSKAFGGGGAPPKVHLNPFKRRRDAPVVFWSGVVDAGADRREVTYQVPDYFAGKLNVMAVMVCDEAIGQNENGVLIKGPMVLTPNVPLFASPGDEFTASVTVANNLESGEKDEISVTLEPDSRLELLSRPGSPLLLEQGEEGTARFKMRVVDDLGGAELKFTAVSGDEEMSRQATMSVRPAAPFMTHIQSGYFRLGGHEVDTAREMYPQFRKTVTNSSSLPLGLARGLESYLSSYPHGCTEQTTSKAMGRLMLADEADFGFDKQEAVKAIQIAMARLSSRQNSNGGFGYWSSQDVRPPADDFLTVYVTSFLVAARHNGYAVPSSMWDLAIRRIKEISTAEVSNMDQAMNQAAAIYYLARASNKVSGNALLNLRDTLEKHYAGLWETDLTAMYVASTYKLLKKDKEADALMERYLDALGTKPKDDDDDYRREYHHDPDARNALGFALVCHHFGDVAKDFAYADLQPIIKPIEVGRVNTISSSALIQALKAYSSVASESGVETSIIQKNADGGVTTLVPMTGGFVEAPFDSSGSGIRFELEQGESNLGAFYQVVESGFDKGAPTEVIRDGIEVVREFVDADGKPVTTLRVGDPVTVRIAVRNISPRVLTNLAVLDLLPGGFEVEANALKPGVGTVPGADFVEVREDRNVFFLGLGKNDLRTFSYRIKPVADGTFVIPPVFAESMYDRGMKARSGGGTIVVTPAEGESNTDGE